MRTIGNFSYGKVAVKSDTVDSPTYDGRIPDAYWVSEAGVVVLVMGDGSLCPFTCAAGTLLPVSAKRINSTNTPGTLFVALWQA